MQGLVQVFFVVSEGKNRLDELLGGEVSVSIRVEPPKVIIMINYHIWT
jgi:hypothetical protein